MRDDPLTSRWDALPSGITPFPNSDPAADPSWPSHLRRSRMLLYSHDSAGLGHTRRTLALANEISWHAPETSILWLAGSPHVGAYELPSNLDFLRMPWTGLRGAYSVPFDMYPTVAMIRHIVVQGVVDTFMPDLVVVDFLPDGMRGELRLPLIGLREAHPEAKIVLIMRDIIDAPSNVERRWGRPDVQDLIERVYDQVLIYGSQDTYDFAHEYGWSSDVINKITYCGYIDRKDPFQPPEQIREHLGLTDPALPLVVVTVGGGWDGAAIIETYLAVLTDRRLNLPPLASFIVTGPSLDLEARARLEVAAATLDRVTIASFTNDMLSYLNAADLVVTMGGYNTMCEVLSLGKRAIVVPRVEPVDQEQFIRAERFAERGYVNMLLPNEMTAESLAGLMLRALSSPPPVVTIDFGGLENAGALLANMLNTDTSTIKNLS